MPVEEMRGGEETALIPGVATQDGSSGIGYSAAFCIRIFGAAVVLGVSSDETYDEMVNGCRRIGGRLKW
jgi:hypothetical protein